MTLEDLTAYHYVLCDSAAKLMVTKNRDYSDGDDRWRNFRGSETFGVPTVVGMLIRMQDKLSRISTFARRGDLAVKTESVTDSLVDLINYAVLIGALIAEEKENAKAAALRLSAD